MNKEGVKEYFEKNAESWILDGYRDDGHNYPVAYHRLRIVNSILQRVETIGKAVDLGCGGGDVSIMMVENNFDVTGVDQSQKMIEIANKRILNLNREIGDRIRFINSPLNESALPSNEFDICTAMGVIGYLTTDEILFNTAADLLKPGGLFLLSCRNRLFNMQSVSFRTADEIRNGEAIALIDELDELYKEISLKSANEMLEKLKQIANDLQKNEEYDAEKAKSPSEKYADQPQENNFEPRQHTPKRLKAVAEKCGFELEEYIGVHPHLMDARLNKLLPPQVFNKISGCLEVLESEPFALTCSSVFIGVFKKK